MGESLLTRSRQTIVRLTNSQLHKYQSEGYSYPHRVLETEQAVNYRKKLESFESRHGLLMKSPFKNKPHLV